VMATAAANDARIMVARFPEIFEKLGGSRGYDARAERPALRQQSPATPRDAFSPL